MTTHNLKPTFVVSGIVVLTLIFWLLSYPHSTFRHHTDDPFLIYSSQLLGITGFCLFSLSFILSARIKWVENYFGGLDKMYHLHHTLGKVAFFLLLIHPMLLAARWVPDNLKKVSWYLFPVHKHMEINLGSWSLLGLTLLIIFTLIIKIPYDKWKITHKFTGLFFLLGVLHIFMLDSFITDHPALASYLLLFSLAGIGAFLYKSVFYNLLAKKHYYSVQNIHRMNGNVMEINLIPKKNKLTFIPGQFCFFKFINKEITKETHPFTLCSAADNDGIGILVKTLGDYTNNLYKKLTENTTAVIDGPFGQFNYQQGMPNQIWIAGGVGVAPFVSWIRNISKKDVLDYNINFYYCVRNRADGIYIEEFQEMERKTQNFKFHLVCSKEKGHLKVSDLQDIQTNSIFICGPKKLRTSLVKDLKKLKIPSSHLYYEDFDFL
ncbi:ferredoxin reductase family protein [Abyssalbus ytuae]|uniref:Ferric reductase-like transmembrane domain-containing protein n=1 Tax=Abyssalbus ytuae TaxID=2926907 RepID=A0A9E7CTF7_9FLAO|nr:ferric reductase-like transmembrane domain-containing protein [Abyssalbus ytuae]UOB16092.1 ferric reductase-like transmembrane domain-containing protein [Abyssalbus ytuae]